MTTELQSQKMAEDAIAKNKKAMNEIAHLNKLIEETKHKRDVMFKNLGITEEIKKQDISVSDLPSGERKIFDFLQSELLAELHAKGIDLDTADIKKKTTVGLTMARKRLKI